MNRTLIESWNGSSWTIDTSPNNGTAYNVLDGVSCRPATGSCTAVGYAYNSSLGATRTLIESWNGSSWEVVPSPNNGTAYNVLIGVSCRPGNGSCTAVGYDFDTTVGDYQTLIESNTSIT